MIMIIAAIVLLAGLPTAAPEQAPASAVSAALAAQVQKALDVLEPRLVALESGDVPAEVKGELPSVRANFGFARGAAGRGNGFYALVPLQGAWISVHALEGVMKMKDAAVAAAGHDAWFAAIGTAREAGSAASHRLLAAGGRTEALQAIAADAQNRSDVVYRTSRQWLKAEMPIGFYYYSSQSEGFRTFAAWCLALDLPGAGPRATPAPDAPRLVKAVDDRLIGFSKSKGYVRDKHGLIVQANTWIESAKQLLADDPLTARYAALTSSSYVAMLEDNTVVGDAALAQANTELQRKIDRSKSDATLARFFSERAAEALLREGDAAAINRQTARALIQTVIPRILEQE